MHGTSPSRFDLLEVDFNQRMKTGVPKDTDGCHTFSSLSDYLKAQGTAQAFVATYGQCLQVTP